MNIMNVDAGAAVVGQPESRALAFVKDNGLMLLLAAMVVGQVLASSGSGSTGGSEFQDLYDLVLGWTEGVLGKTIAVSAFLLGMIMGVAKQSIWAFAIGILFAACFAFGPGIIDGVFTAGFQL